MDIANDNVLSGDYKKDEDPKTFQSQKTGRGPLTGDWKVSNAMWMDRWALNELTALKNGRDQGRTESSKYVASLLKRLQNNKIELESGKFFISLSIEFMKCFQKSAEPVMTAYKLVTIQFKW